MYVVVVVGVTALLSTICRAQTTAYCDGKPYNPSQYTCYNGLLCPVINGVRTKACGGSCYLPSQYTCYHGLLCPYVNGEATLRCGKACYLPEAYTCTNGVLGQHPPITHPYLMKALNSPVAALNGQTINACDFMFHVGGKTCTYCPSEVGPACGSVTNTTKIDPGGGAMDAEVPGGQQVYIEAQGLYGYTEAHSANVPPGATVGGTLAYEGGYVVNTLGDGWLACPNSAGQYIIVAQRPGVLYAATCVTLNIATKDPGSNEPGAWQYI